MSELRGCACELCQFTLCKLTSPLPYTMISRLMCLRNCFNALFEGPALVLTHCLKHVEYWGRSSPSDQCSQQRAVCELTADTVRAGCAPYAVARGQLHAIHLASCSRRSAAVGRRCLLAFAGRPAACRVFVTGDFTATPCWSSNASCSA